MLGCGEHPYIIHPRLQGRRGVPPMSTTPQRKIQDLNPKKFHQGRVHHTPGHTRPLTTHHAGSHPARTTHAGSHTEGSTHDY